jgi:hypothetical protein
MHEHLVGIAIDARLYDKARVTYLCDIYPKRAVKRTLRYTVGVSE